MTTILNKAIALVLNRNWQAINVRTPQEAFCMMATNVATALDIEFEEMQDAFPLPVRRGEGQGEGVWRQAGYRRASPRHSTLAPRPSGHPPSLVGRVDCFASSRSRSRRPHRSRPDSRADRHRRRELRPRPEKTPQAQRKDHSAT